MTRHIWFKDKYGVPYGFVRNEAGEIKTVYVTKDEFERYLQKPSEEAMKWKSGDWTDIPREEAITLYLNTKPV